jgi:hypothetical protein
MTNIQMIHTWLNIVRFHLEQIAAFKKTGNYSGNFLKHLYRFSIINTLQGNGIDYISIQVIF